MSIARSMRWVLLVAAILVLTSCHGGPHEVAVTTTADGSDAVPGDGICEMTPGLGDCSLRAAIDEANANPDITSIAVPAGTYPLSTAGIDETNVGGDLDVDPAAEALEIRGDFGGVRVDASGADGVIDVRGGLVRLRNVALTGASGPGARVGDGGRLEVLSSAGHANGGPGAEVHPGGTLLSLHSTWSGNGAGGVNNEGSATIGVSTVADNTGGGLVGSAPMLVRGSILGPQSTGADCSVSATSEDHNIDSDGSCGLGSPSDLSGVDPQIGPLSDATVPFHHPLEGSPALDSAPLDGDCGTGLVAQDQRAVARPQGADCDRGAVEARFALDLLVDSGGDGGDINPGDTFCTTAEGTCTLRAAIDETNRRDHTTTHTIALAANPTFAEPGVGGEDANQAGDLDVHTNLRIIGDGHTIDAAGHDRVLDHHDGSLEIESVTITGGDATQGPGDVLDTDGTAEGFEGGGIRSASHLTLTASTVSGNRAHWGGGIAHDGGLLTTLNSTIAANTAPAYQTLPDVPLPPDTQGAPPVVCKGFTCVRILPGRGGGLLTTAGDIEFTTIAGNAADDDAAPGSLANGGGLYTFDGAATVRATVLTGNIAGHGASCDGTVTSGGHNHAEDTSCGLGAGGDVEGLPALLEALADNGGPTHTRLPYANSPVVGAIPDATAGLCDGTVTVDQRGAQRPDGVACDKGSVEGSTTYALVALDLLVTHPGDEVDALPGDGTCQDASETPGACSLRAAIMEANAWPDAATITIAEGVDPVLSIPGADEDGAATGDLDVTSEITILGQGATVDAAGLDRVFHAEDALLDLDGVTITGGVVDGSHGGGLYVVDSDLTVTDSTITGNRIQDLAGTASGGGVFVRGPSSASISTTTISDNEVSTSSDWAGLGGGIRASTGVTLVLDRSTVSGNRILGSSHGQGGGVAAGGGAEVTVVDSTISGNWIESGGHGGNVAAEFSNSVLVVLRSTLVDGVAEDGRSVSGPATVIGSILDAGTASNCSVSGAGAAAPVSGGYNLVRGSGCGFAGLGDMADTDALLGPLDDVGGPTLVHLPAPGSPAIDHIPFPTAGACETSGPAQNEVVRPFGSSCDVGSVEVAAP